jgi:hypothetical protein
MEIFDYGRNGDAAERGYVAWVKQHPCGFVINRRGNALRLHKTGCKHFYDETSNRILTKNRKICSDNRQQLESWVVEHSPTPLEYCRGCKTG